MLVKSAPFRAGLAICIASMGTFLCARPVFAELDRSRYMAPNELRPGMKGFGRTVMSGTRIDTFEFEVVSVMTNAYYPKQDVILVRCSGLNLEHSGIIGGMSGSPCYITDEQGNDRMIGAVAYGWQFNKDPLCGVQPITQMLEIAKVRDPARRPARDRRGGSLAASSDALASGRDINGRIDIGQLIARVWHKPISPSSCFSIFNEDIAKADLRALSRPSPLPGLEPLKTPVTITGGNHPAVLEFIRDALGRFAMEPMAAGGPTAATKAEMSDSTRLEPGSTLCIPLISGDLNAEALGTCTEVDGNRVLGFGHAMEAAGWVELPLATGMVHTVVPSVMRSNKLGGALKTVGTLWGDESTGIFGTIGKSPDMIPMDIDIENARGRDTYRCKVVSAPTMTAGLLASAIMEAIYAHSEPPREHTISYKLEIEFGDLGTFRTSNFTSQEGAFSLGLATILPTVTLMNSPFGDAKVTRARAEIKIQEGARAARVDQVILDRSTYKPGQTVRARVRWAHERSEPAYTEETYSLKLPDDINDGEYTLSVVDARSHLGSLRSEKPHLFRAESLRETLDRFNMAAANPGNKLFLRLTLPKGGLAVKNTELPDLPSHMTRILSSTRRGDVQAYRETIVREHVLPFAVSGGESFSIKVDRRADQ